MRASRRQGYRLACPDGGLFNDGDATLAGAAYEVALDAPIVGLGG